MSILIVLDDAHMGNRLYMNAFGSAVKALMTDPVVLLHDCAEHTEALIQTGMMRRDASVRAARETNRKLTTWLADFGIAATGVQGDRRGLIRIADGRPTFRMDLFNTFPSNTLRVVCTLVEDADGAPATRPITELSSLLQTELAPKKVFFAADMGKNGFFH